MSFLVVIIAHIGSMGVGMFLSGHLAKNNQLYRSGIALVILSIFFNVILTGSRAWLG